ncbi:Redoxin domain protein [Isosphaera pallida ATCC 43644]|uniref:Redoxin domain protein n=1 Tax=Isosphaera pallida (strain ATCC 43644 / DSM 9630 / IS1B) TaxID=575540 RepID=E8QXF8_ISOPI|nr:TlpA disulfide reductase family protein [Isosphaera pallida]ADV61999.1 Redoxin domain protein [Isosphaera pallida ATCC 43644]
MTRFFALPIACVLALVGATTAFAQDATLKVGDPAPKIQVKEFVQGEKVESFEKNQVYVIEFWATWCPPCRTSIPHLNELQKKYGDKVVIIGLNAFEPDAEKKVKPFIEKMGDKMTYRVALDEVPEGSNPSEGFMAKNWMMAAKQRGIPTAFIVADGKIAWIGHPMSMDEPLKTIVSANIN